MVNAKHSYMSHSICHAKFALLSKLNTCFKSSQVCVILKWQKCCVMPTQVFSQVTFNFCNAIYSLNSVMNNLCAYTVKQECLYRPTIFNLNRQISQPNNLRCLYKSQDEHKSHFPKGLWPRGNSCEILPPSDSGVEE